ncbi:MAG: TRAP transporter substrate-binding protein DctP [Oscillibacter sp.]|nr:TRAP transporter substrate-binding protein DctP [Oscillibacter sp.]
MKKMKRILAALMIGASLFTLTACGGSGGSGGGASSGSSSGGGSDASSGGSEPQVVVQIAYENFPGEPWDIACNEWAKLIEERSGGTMSAQIFHSGQLGSKNDLLDQMLMGEPIITIGDGSFWADYGAPELGITSAPYVYDTWDQVWKLIGSDWYKEQEELLAQNGLRILTTWAYGERNLMSTRPVYTIEDMKGLIVRTPNTTSYMRAFEAMGAAPTAMALNDVYTATQQGTIDGMENPMATLYGQSYYEVAQYITMTQHIKMPAQQVCSEQFFQSLTPEQQQILKETGEEAGVLESQKQDEMLEQYVADMEAEGVTIIELDDAERAKFKEAAATIYDDPAVSGQWRDGLYEMVQEIIG